MYDMSDFIVGEKKNTYGGAFNTKFIHTSSTQ